jgi:hypothetical protein
MGIASSVKHAWDIIKPEIDTITGAVKGMLETIFPKQLPAMQQVHISHMIATGEISSDIAGELDPNRLDLGGRIKNAIETAKPQISAALSTLGTIVGEQLDEAFWFAVDKLSDVGTRITGILSGVFGTVRDWISSGGALEFVKGIGEAVVQMGQWIVTNGPSTLSNAMTGLITSLW